MKRFRLIAIISTLVLSFVLFLSPLAFAQSNNDATGLVLRPAIVDLPAKRGTTISTTITVQNISGSAVSVTIGSQSLIPNDPLIDQQKRKDTDASTWVLSRDKTVLLEEDEIRDVDIQFLVPEDAGPGDHSALVTFSANLLKSSKDGSVVLPVLSSLVFINVEGDVNEAAELSGLRIPTFIFGGTQHGSFDISNTGNVHLLPSATVRLYTRGGTLLETQQIQPQLVLPNTRKTFVFDWNTKEHRGLANVVVEVNYGTPMQAVTLESGNILLLPDAGNMFLWLLSVAAGLFLLYLIFKRPLRRLRRLTRHKRHYRPKKRGKKTNSLSNKPSDMAKLSMNPNRLDELLSRDRRSALRRAATKPTSKKRRKIDL